MFMQGDKVRVVGSRRGSFGTRIGEVLAGIQNESGVYVVGFPEHGEPNRHAYVIVEADLVRPSKQEIERAEREAEAAAQAAVKRKEKESETK